VPFLSILREYWMDSIKARDGNNETCFAQVFEKMDSIKARGRKGERWCVIFPPFPNSR